MHVRAAQTEDVIETDEENSRDGRAGCGMTTSRFGSEFELTRVPGDRRLYALGGIGTLRLRGMLLRSATASACDGTWRFTRRSVWQRSLRATDALGREVGTFRPREIRRGGTVRWRGREYSVRPDSVLRERYALALGDRDLVMIEATGCWGWGARRPVRLRLEHPDAVENGLLLFASFVVRTLADAAAADAGVTAAITTTWSGA